MPAPPAGLLNYGELLVRPQNRRAFARGVAKPELRERTAEGGKPMVQCPGCNSWRPAFCLAATASGWKCDGCISDERRRGTFVEW